MATSSPVRGTKRQANDDDDDAALSFSAAKRVAAPPAYARNPKRKNAEDPHAPSAKRRPPPPPMDEDMAALAWFRHLTDTMVQEQLRADPVSAGILSSWNEAVEHIIPRIVEGTMLVVFDKVKCLKHVYVYRGLHFTMASITETDGFTRDDILPVECAQRSCDYESTALVTLDHYQGPFDPRGSRRRHDILHDCTLMRTWHDFPYFRLPVMQGSVLCNTLRPEHVQQAQASRLTAGGTTSCVILGGNAKCVKLQQRVRFNAPLNRIVRRAPNGDVLQCRMEYRASHEYRVRTTSTLVVEVNGVGARHALTPDIAITVQFIPVKLQLCATFVLLGCATAVDIRQCLIPFGEAAEPLPYITLVTAILDTCFPTTPTQPELLQYIHMEREKQRIPYPPTASNPPNPPTLPLTTPDPAIALATVLALFDMEFLPFAEFETISKAEYFGVLIRELLRVYLGLAAEDIRDTVVSDCNPYVSLFILSKCGKD